MTSAASHHEPHRGQLYEVHRGLIEPVVAEDLRARYERNVADVSTQLGVSQAAVERVASAWGAGSALVADSMRELAPALQSALVSTSDLAADLCAPIDATLFAASSRSPAGTHGHQDISYRWGKPASARYAYTTWIALSNCDEDAGALRFSDSMPGAVAEPRQDFLQPGFVDAAVTARWKAGERVVSAAPGDVVLFDALTWHASTPFTGSGRKLALAIRWSSGSQWERGLELPPPTPTQGFGMDTSGQLLGDVISAACQRPQPEEPGPGTTRRLLDALRRDHAEVLHQLPAEAQRAAHDLSLALALLEEHGARPAAHTWREIRDETIPALRAIAERRST